MFRADAKKRYWALYVSESCAGERLRLAGFSSGQGVCARGGCSARHEGAVAAAGFLAGTSIFFSIVASLPARLSPREMCRTGTANEDFSTARRGVVFRLKRADV